MRLQQSVRIWQPGALCYPQGQTWQVIILSSGAMKSTGWYELKSPILHLALAATCELKKILKLCQREISHGTTIPTQLTHRGCESRPRYSVSLKPRLKTTMFTLQKLLSPPLLWPDENESFFPPNFIRDAQRCFWSTGDKRFKKRKHVCASKVTSFFR